MRANAVTALLAILAPGDRKREALPSLLAALGDPESDVETRAADGLAGWFLDEAGVGDALTARVPSLRAATGSPDPIVQAHAISALEKMGEPPPAASILAAHNAAIRRRGIAQAAAARDVAAVPLLIELANCDPEEVVRMEAIPVAAALAAPDARDAFLASLIDGPSDTLANVAIRAAGETGATGLGERLRRILASPSGDRTAAAVAAANALKDTSAVPAIAAHLADSSPDTLWETKLALDTLVGAPREVPEWQAWARQRGYLLKERSFPSPR
ncbi:MAG TPA: HEAT repeat domain-containing protein [Thermoanaerobaculia bacterium]